jgi:hypothetical protein
MRCFNVIPSRNSIAMKVCPCLVVNLVNGADVGMIQCRGCLGFALKSAKGLRIFGHVVREEFESYKAAQLHVFSFVDDTHPASAQFLDDAVVRDGLADHISPIIFGGLGPGAGLIHYAASPFTCTPAHFSSRVNVAA